MVNFVRKVLPNLPTVIEPRQVLQNDRANTEGSRHWGPEHDKAVIEVKQLSTSAPVFHFPDFSKPFTVHVDASDTSAGAFVAQ